MQSEQRSKGHVTLGFSLVHELNDSTLRMCQYVLWSERTVLTYCRMHGEKRKLSVQPALISHGCYNWTKRVIIRAQEKDLRFNNRFPFTSSLKFQLKVSAANRSNANKIATNGN